MTLPEIRPLRQVLGCEYPSILGVAVSDVPGNPAVAEQTDFLVQRPLGLDVVFLELIVEFLESFQVLDSDSHLLDFLPRK